MIDKLVVDKLGKEKLTLEEFYAGLGLFILAKRKMEELDNLQRELGNILRGDRSTAHDRINDWVGDFIYDDGRATIKVFLELLDRLKIEVDDTTQTNAEFLLKANEQTKNVKNG